MSERRTYRERRAYSAKVMRFRLGVYAHRRTLTPGCLLLLLRLSDDMDARCIVSVPRGQLAADLDCPPSRITEWVQEAKDARFLDVVRRARPKVTAAYCGLVNLPSEVRPSGPLNHEFRGTPPVSSEGYAPADLSEGGQRYAPGGSQEGEQAEGTVAVAETHRRDDRSEEKTSRSHPWPVDEPTARREAAS